MRLAIPNSRFASVTGDIAKAQGDGKAIFFAAKFRSQAESQAGLLQAPMHRF
ncbi:hypothetical protein RJJ64_19880 [Rhizobium hidalgonense]|nr:hypothetical protein [Rhizobium hidalgonense]MDR9812649.1 hypothetical protein [Rhizobium hidalgonense]